MRRHMPTAKTTVLPANDGPTPKRDLLYARRLDDSFDTEDLEMPDRPMACTRSSTRRVETSAIRATWITLQVKQNACKLTCEG